MVGKDGELGDIDDEGLARVKLIAEKKRQLEQTADQVRQEISSCFERLIDALRGRERQLLRQVEAVHRQQLALVQSNSDLLPASASLGAELSSEPELLARLRDFGRIDLSNSIAVKDFEPYRAEEYQEAGEDVVSFDKSLKSEADEFDVSSVMRRKRDSHGNVTKPVVINFSCTSCDLSVESANGNDVPAVASTSRQFDECQGAGAAISNNSSSNSSDSPFVDNESDSEDSSAEEDAKPRTQSEESSCLLENTDDEETKLTSSSSLTEKLTASCEGENANVTSATDANENATGVETAQDKSKDGLADEHPIQIQQWLRQILAETETEPIVNEIGRPIVSQFPKIPNTTRLYREFPVET